jgi:HK97 family phage major capsid protein
MASANNQDLAALQKAASDLAGLMATFEAERKEAKGVTSATLEKLEAMQKQVDTFEKKINDKVASEAETEEPLLDVFKQNASIKRLMDVKSGNAKIELTAPQVHRLVNQYNMSRKTVISSSSSGLGSGTIGYAASGVLQIDRLPGITMEARQALVVRDQFVARPTNLPKIDFVKVTTPLGPASPQQETVIKQESQLSLASASEMVQTLAIWVPASKQLLTDLEELLAFVQDSLPYYVNLLEDQQFLNGDATGENLHGIVPQAAAFNTGLLGSSYTKIDIIGHAIQQIAMANEVPPTFVAMNTQDYWNMVMTKDSYGRYILGDPNSPYVGKVWGLTPVPTNSMTAGKFLVGSGDPAVATIRDRMDMALDISTEHLDYFARNMIAIRCEKRTCMIVRRPNAFVTGSFTTSP